MAAYVAQHGRAHQGGRLFWGPLKAFADGALGSATALMHEPYDHQPHTRGLATLDFRDLAALIGNASEACLQVSLALCRALGSLTVCAGATPACMPRSLLDSWLAAVHARPRPGQSADHALGRLQVAVHAIGDRAVDEVSASFHAAAQRAHVPSGGHDTWQPLSLPCMARRRLPQGCLMSVAGFRHTSGVTSVHAAGCTVVGHRMEHAQHLTGPEAAGRLQQLGLWVVGNPLHLPPGVHTLRTRLHAECVLQLQLQVRCYLPQAVGLRSPVQPAPCMVPGLARHSQQCSSWCSSLCVETKHAAT